MQPESRKHEKYWCAQPLREPLAYQLVGQSAASVCRPVRHATIPNFGGTRLIHAVRDGHEAYNEAQNKTGPLEHGNASHTGRPQQCSQGVAETQVVPVRARKEKDVEIMCALNIDTGAELSI